METFCGVNAGVTGFSGGRMCQFPKGHEITITVRESPPGFRNRDMMDIAEQSMKTWQEVCGVKYRMVTSGKANITILQRKMDGPFGVLAEAELSCGAADNTSLGLWFDSSEKFTTSSNPSSGQIDIVAVCTHEIGHNLGLDHAPRGSDNLMAPSIRRSNQRRLGSWDITNSIARYGEPSLTPGVPGMPTNTSPNVSLNMLLSDGPTSRPPLA
jgi:hypothetical protein